MSSEIDRFLNRAGALLKPAADHVADWVKSGEEYLDPSAVTVDGIKRSLQLDKYSCGAQSCYMILDYFGKAGSIENVKKALGTTEDGTGEDEILELLREKRLVVKVIPRGTIKDICHAIDSSAPMLAYTVKKHDHWFVIYGYSDSRIYMLDPSLKKSILCSKSKEEFERYWSGWCAVVNKNGKVPARRTKSK
jgi:ABC-type bacteriocin/lantibiotic exporter with double-glycine peptidase domain